MWRWIPWLLALLWIAQGGPAQAQEEPVPAGQSTEEQQTLLRLAQGRAKAKELLAQGKPAEALATLRATRDVVPTPTLAWDISEPLVVLGRLNEASAELDKYARIPEAERSPPHSDAEIAAQRRAISQRMARIRISADPVGSQASIDGQEVGRTPQTLQVEPGAHRVKVQLGATAQRDVSLAPGQTLVLLAHAPPQPRWPRTARWVALGGGLGAVALGGALWGLDGLRTCGNPYCASELDTRPAGIGLVGTGLGLLGGAALLFVLDAQLRRAERAVLRTPEER